MVWQQAPVVYVLLAAGIGSLLQAGYVAVRMSSGRGRELTAPFLAVALTAGLWALAYGLQIGTHSTGLKVLFLLFSTIGTVGLAVAWPAFVLAYTGRTEWLRSSRLALLAAVPTAVYAYSWLGDPGDLVLHDISVLTVDGMAVFGYSYGPVMAGYAIYSTFINVLMIALLVQAAYESRGVLRRQALILVAIGLFPTILGFAGDLDLFWGIYNAITLIPVGFAVTVPLIAWALSQHGLLEIVPLAKQHVLDHLDEGVVVIDSEDRVLDLNRAAGELFDTDLAGTAVADVFADHPELLAVVDGETDGAKVTAAVDGVERVFEASVVDIPGHVTTNGARALVLHDVTERQQYEQRLQVLNRALRHDLRNDVGVILGGARLLEEWHDEHGSDPAAETALSMIRTKVDELVDMSEKARLVDYSLHRDGDTTASVDVAALVRTTALAAQSTWPAADISVDAPESAWANADTLVGSAIDNVIENSIEHNDRATPEVGVAVENHDGRVVVTVADDGPGIPTADRRVLETGVETPLEHANGLGLWLVSWIVTRSDGDLTITDREPRGTTVRLAFTAADEPESPRRRADAILADD